MADHTIYKVLRAGEWRDFQSCDAYAGTPDDLRDGFIHFSTAQQLPGTLAKYFSGQEGLKLVQFQAGDFGETLKWEAARDGDLFPHLYQPLPHTASKGVWDLALVAGSHLLPDEIKGGGK